MSSAPGIAGLRLLLVEDDGEAAAGAAAALEGAGWAVEVAGDGAQGLKRASDGGFDVLVIDRMLPGLDGLSLTRALRAASVQTPILFLTAVGAVAERVAGLEAGGDDYLVKPYSSDELKARVHALARRSAPAPEAASDTTTLRAGEVTLDRLTRRARRGEREVELLPLEFKLLEFLALNAGRVVTRAMLLEQVWGFHFDPRTNIVETHVSRLRRKIDAPGESPMISTVRGAGYVLG